MQKYILLSLIALLSFSFSKKSKAQSGVNYISGIALLNTATSFDAVAFQKNIKGLEPTDFQVTDGTYSMEIRQAKVVLSIKNTPVAKAEWEPAALISWIWKTATTDVEQHQAQVVIQVSGKDHLALDLYKTLTRVAQGVLESSDAIGMYMNSQYLLLPKSYYLTSAKSLEAGVLPVTLWVYFGMWQENERNSGYTYGLNGFGKDELEVVNSTHGLATVQAFLQETAREVIQSNMTLKTGDYVGDERKVMVRKSKGALIEGQTLKLDY